LEGKWGVRAHQTQEMKGKEGSGDPEGREAKSGLASSGRGLDTSGEKGFLLMYSWGDPHPAPVRGKFPDILWTGPVSSHLF